MGDEFQEKVDGNRKKTFIKNIMAKNTQRTKKGS